MRAKRATLKQHNEFNELERNGFKCDNARDMLINIGKLLDGDMCCNDCKLEIIMKWLVAYYESL